jgi:2-iminoacetate synthase ThiH
MMEENVVASAGVSFRMSEEEIVVTIRDAGFTPAHRPGMPGALGREKRETGVA